MPAATPQDRDATGVPVPPLTGITVLYDARCPLCVHVRDWLVRQPQLVPLDLVPAESEEARRRFPHLDHAATLAEITVVGSGGQVWTGPSAWVVCLWALSEHRLTSHRFATPAGQVLARGALLAAARYRAAHRTPGPPDACRTGKWPG